MSMRLFHCLFWTTHLEELQVCACAGSVSSAQIPALQELPVFLSLLLSHINILSFGETSASQLWEKTLSQTFLPYQVQTYQQSVVLNDTKLLSPLAKPFLPPEESTDSSIFHELNGSFRGRPLVGGWLAFAALFLIIGFIGAADCFSILCNQREEWPLYTLLGEKVVGFFHALLDKPEDIWACKTGGA